MTKKRHSKDKLYLNPKELAQDWGGYKEKQVAHFQALPFHCCGLSLTPFEKPVCTREGIVFDSENIFKYLKTYGRNPITGRSLKFSDLFPLIFHKNAEENFHCPITFKVFNKNTKIVANSKSGHVYCSEAIDNLCRKAKNWHDLITGEPFNSTDIITIQDPHSIESRKIEEFDYIKKGLEFKTQKSDLNPEDLPSIKQSDLSQRVLNQTKDGDSQWMKDHRKLMKTAKPELKTSSLAPRHQIYTTSKQAASLTSTTMEPSNTTEYRELTSQEIMLEYYQWVKKNKKKGYVRIVTNKGTINLELHCDLVPRTCDNFLRHCQSNYYVGTNFHRCIANFLIQGGDKSGTGLGGESSFEDHLPFEDEFHPHLTHKGLGILSMSNRGKNMNTSEFFFTFKSCEHLNNKYTVFGRVVGGLDVLKSWEKLEVNRNNKPKDPIIIESTLVFSNPFDMARIAVEKEKQNNIALADEKLNLFSTLTPTTESPSTNIPFHDEYANVPKINKHVEKKFNFNSW